jgi:hypothetical protein
MIRFDPTRPDFSPTEWDSKSASSLSESTYENHKRESRYKEGCEQGVGCHGRSVSDPGANDVNGIGLGQFSFSSTPAVLEWFRPGLQIRFADDTLELGPQIGIAATVSGDYPLRAWLGLFPHLLQIRPYLRKQGNLPRFFTFVVFRLRAVDCNSAVFPIHVTPP